MLNRKCIIQRGAGYIAFITLMMDVGSDKFDINHKELC